MFLKKIKPYGWCKGVSMAYDKILRTIKEQPDKKFYLYKCFVHNQHTNKLIEELKIKIINDLDEISDVKNSILFLQTHGSKKSLINEIIKREINFVDLKCPFVNANLIFIKKYLDQGYDVIYLGKKNHAEALAACSLNENKTHLVGIDDYQNLKLVSNKVAFVSQTTINKKIVDQVIEFYSKQFKNLIAKNGTCIETINRQKSLNEHIKEFDYLIIVGEQISSNTIEITKIAKEHQVSYQLVDAFEKINFDLIDWNKKVGLASGASTNKLLVEQIYDEIVKKLSN